VGGSLFIIGAKESKSTRGIKSAPAFASRHQSEPGMRVSSRLKLPRVKVLEVSERKELTGFAGAE
jgi:hypothetical protein